MSSDSKYDWDEVRRPKLERDDIEEMQTSVEPNFEKAINVVLIHRAEYDDGKYIVSIDEHAPPIGMSAATTCDDETLDETVDNLLASVEAFYKEAQSGD